MFLYIWFGRFPARALRVFTACPMHTGLAPETDPRNRSQMPRPKARACSIGGFETFCVRQADPLRQIVTPHRSRARVIQRQAPADCGRLCGFLRQAFAKYPFCRGKVTTPSLCSPEMTMYLSL
jgi:hypothetical protein